MIKISEKAPEFSDVTAYQNGEFKKISLSDLRYAAGLSLAWNSPVGPLKFSVAGPLNSKPEDKIQRLQFTLGHIF
mgnify:CR=1 FL=1